MVEPTCRNCRFHHAFTIPTKKGSKDPEGTRVYLKGECRRHPPLAQPQKWPRVNLGDWCGEWQEKGEKE